MPIRCVTFDWGDTLVTNRGNPYRESFRRALAAMIAELEAAGHRFPNDWDARCLTAVSEAWGASGDLERHPDHREVDALVPLRSALDEIDGLSGDDLESELLGPAIARLFERFMGVLQPFPGVHETLGRLRERGLRIGILSHVPWPQAHCLAWYLRNRMAPLIDFYSLSSGIGWIKPHHAHYDHALQQAGCRADEVLHVGDHPLRDVIGAREYGLRTCLKRTEGFYDEAELDACQPDAVILHVAEIPALLDDPPWEAR